MISIADLIACSTCFGHHYAHHRELESIIQKVAACGIRCFGFQVVGMVLSWGLCVRFAGCCNLKTRAPNTTGSNLLYNTLELLMMGIMVPEKCWARNKICNKNHLLHLVGILFPHINDDTRSKSLQIYNYVWLHLSILVKKVHIGVISGVRCCVNDVFLFLGRYTALICIYLPTFRKSISAPSSRIEQSIDGTNRLCRNSVTANRRCVTSQKNEGHLTQRT